ncbi:putative Acyl carrier protein homolog [Mesomycoplasma conjunctivae]|uniref:PUTATIVE Acyl carrier protein homolog n=1 Tax=Mesomycoplasma conjunctivae (strain ATCC 25834 / NCTC 10147 / HRC/581) TaxID=572263 RepID=C5J785_MESCH|nr:phosphopantetheine-binding protein [Mesomycoplasma conjunctivae]CAT05348.1 PUTATIVE Acyl carrier protein homolog [Mesomycoplasma conjunctivae]VEU66575.1 putative Acyl carrier protein homolog [Mesomycoplasma conjunctivae]
MQKKIYEKLRKYTKKSFNDNSNIREIGIDSLDFIQIITHFEDEFEISVTDDELLDIKTVGDIVLLINKKTK